MLGGWWSKIEVTQVRREQRNKIVPDLQVPAVPASKSSSFGKHGLFRRISKEKLLLWGANAPCFGHFVILTHMCACLLFLTKQYLKNAPSPNPHPQTESEPRTAKPKTLGARSCVRLQIKFDLANRD